MTLRESLTHMSVNLSMPLKLIATMKLAPYITSKSRIHLRLFCLPSNPQGVKGRISSISTLRL